MADTAAKKLTLRIITPEEIKVDKSADMIIMRCTTGDLGVLPGHEARTCVLADGDRLRIFENGAEHQMFVYGGLVEIKDDVLSVLTVAAENPEEIDQKQAREARERAENRLRDSVDTLEIKKIQARIRREQVRIEVSAYSVIGK
ncbi:MAG: ATP synthase F1 subunit epsilon [Oscillospiraceae bacterium]|nr:ATP synthase F1 subunit epsilon [Oscillospiraceae bacterium]